MSGFASMQAMIHSLMCMPYTVCNEKCTSDIYRPPRFPPPPPPRQLFC